MSFLFDTANVLKSVKPVEEGDPVRLDVEQVLTMHTDRDSLNTISNLNWEEAFLERTNRKDVKTMIRGLPWLRLSPF